jgi:hypothetical protein
MSLKSIDLTPEPEETPIERVSNRYGIPKEEVEALIGGKPVAQSKPHPLTMGALMDNGPKQKEREMSGEKQLWSPIAVLGAILGVISILSLIVLLVFIMRAPKRPEMAIIPRMDTIATPAPISRPAEVPPAVVQDTIASTPVSVEVVKPALKPATKRTPLQSKTYLTTTNSLEAEEKLAELRAEGNHKAKINISSKNGVTTYKVQ